MVRRFGISASRYCPLQLRLDSSPPPKIRKALVMLPEHPRLGVEGEMHGGAASFQAIVVLRCCENLK